MAVEWRTLAALVDCDGRGGGGVSSVLSDASVRGLGFMRKAESSIWPEGGGRRPDRGLGLEVVFVLGARACVAWTRAWNCAGDGAWTWAVLERFRTSA